MSPNAAFLTRLCRIADASAPREERSACASALLDAYTTRLYDRLGITATPRPSRRAKAQAEDVLGDLRLRVLKMEIGAPACAAEIFATTRHRIEMTRRALAIRLASDEGAGDRSVARVRAADRVIAVRPSRLKPGQRRATACREDRRWIAEIHRRLDDRRVIATSWEAIRQSRYLLARFDGPPVQ
jgi:hypothetical protein